MPPKMSSSNRKSALDTLRWHYQRAASKSAKSLLITNACQIFGLERKYVIKLLRTRRGPPDLSARGRGGSARKYQAVDIGIIKAIWLLAEQPCGKRLHAVLPVWLPAWEQHHGALEDAVRERLGAISPAQLDRVLRPFKVGAGRPPRLGNAVRSQIPLRTGPWEVEGPGWIEADTVAHCGGSMRGAFAWSLVLTDIATGWTEAGATWNRSDRVIHERVVQIEGSLPFAILGFDSDNGGEFINETLLRYFRQRKSPVVQSRSRPYHKNDNAHVEQKNRTLIRQLLGERRLEPLAIVEPLNRLLRRWSLWNNLYSPTLKLLGKEPSRQAGGRPRRLYEKGARTPCQRLLAQDSLSEKGRAQLERLLREHDPITLKLEIEAMLTQLWGQVAAHASQAA